MTGPRGEDVIRLCASNIAPVMDAAAVVLVLRLTLDPTITAEVILSPDQAEDLARDLAANVRYLRSRDPIIWDRP